MTIVKNHIVRNFIENFAGNIIRLKHTSYLRFDPKASPTLPILKDKPLMMYVHIPFCQGLCMYCSFHKFEFSEGLAKEYFAALKKEILMHKQAGHNFQAVYFGGGTPTVLLPELLYTISIIKSLFGAKEISVETSPNHLDEERLKQLQDIGVSRLSVGVQSFDNKVLKAAGRYDKYGCDEELQRKIAVYKSYFPTFNIDMMFNFPLQTEDSLNRDLEIIQELNVSQVTYYPLMVSDSTRNAIKSIMGNVDNNRGRKLYNLIEQSLSENYDAATAWCFNRKNQAVTLIDEYVISYSDYAGLGCGSIGYLNGSIYANSFDVSQYIQVINSGKFPVAARRDCSKREQLLYEFLMQLFGLSLDLKKVSKKHNVTAALWLLPEIIFFMLIGGLEWALPKGTLHVKDRYYWVVMMREFFTSVNNFRDYCRHKG